MRSLYPSLVSVAMLAVALDLAHSTSAVDTPWMLGDEASVACYTLSTKEDIPKPVGLEMHWTAPPAVPLDSTKKNEVQYWARVQDNFWNHSSNIDLLGADYAKYYRLCLNETGGCDASGDCCIWHSNVHSCRAESGSCEPWVSQSNATGDGGAAYTLVTHTPSLEGGMERFDHEVQLEDGDWVIIAHVKIMTFQCAVGATRISVAPPPTAGTSTTVVLSVVIPLLIVLLAVVGGSFYYLRTRAQSEVRDISDAPQETGSEVTLLFTDIQDSTNLWSNYTASMAYSLDVHHDVIRKCIKRHHGYEVKTAGDAFMIAVKSAADGLKIARDIQTDLMEQEFPRCITQHYLEEELEDNVDDLTSADPQSSVFHGVRVRIGIHTGFPDIQWDEVSKGFDYYGPPVNLAARVEGAAAGGQILMSEATKNKLEESAVDHLKSKPQGHIIPKGLSEPHAVYTAVCAGSGKQFARMEKREFPELLLGRGGDDFEGGESPQTDGVVSMAGVSQMGGGMGAGGSRGDYGQSKMIDRLFEQFKGEIPYATLSSTMEDRMAFIKTVLKPLSKSKGQNVLDNLCAGWRVKPLAPNRGQDATLVQLCGRIIPAESGRLKQEVAAVRDFSGSFSLQDGDRSLAKAPYRSFHQSMNAMKSPLKTQLSSSQKSGAAGKYKILASPSSPGLNNQPAPPSDSEGDVSGGEKSPRSPQLPNFNVTSDSSHQ